MTLYFDLQDLIEDLKDELGGNFEDVCVMMLASPRETDARELNKAIRVCTLCHPTPSPRIHADAGRAVLLLVVFLIRLRHGSVFAFKRYAVPSSLLIFRRWSWMQPSCERRKTTNYLAYACLNWLNVGQFGNTFSFSWIIYAIFQLAPSHIHEGSLTNSGRVWLSHWCI